jgi:hypothetical protein
MSLLCEYCKKEFTSKYSLKRHTECSKKCLESRGEVSTSICNFCKDSFSKGSIKHHINNCFEYKIQKYVDAIEEKDKIIKEQKEQILILQDKIENIAIKSSTRPTTITNNTQNNNLTILQPLTVDDIKQKSKNLTIDHILKGAAGYGKFVLDNLSEQLLVTDVNRRNVKFKSKEGSVILDKKMIAFTKILGAGINETNKRLIEKYIHKESELMERKGMTEFEIAEKMLPVRQQCIHIAKMVKGDQNVLTKEICKYICTRLGSKTANELLIEAFNNSDSDFIIEEDSDDQYISLVN